MKWLGVSQSLLIAKKEKTMLRLTYVKMAKVDIIICVYNNIDIIGECLESIKKQSYKDYNCLVVDDKSNDGTVELIKQKYSWVDVIEKKENSGPSISRNIGLRITNSKYIATLDSDVVLDKDWLKNMVEFMRKKDEIGNKGKEGGCGIIASKLLLPDKKINAAGSSMTKIGIGFDIGMNKTEKKFLESKQVLYACSAAMLIRRDVINKIGMFDEEYFYSYEDLDIGLRANIAGYKVFYNPASAAVHNLNTTVSEMSSRVYFHSTKNKIRTLIKNYELCNLFIYLPILLIVTAGDIIFRKKKLAKLKGLL